MADDPAGAVGHGGRARAARRPWRAALIAVATTVGLLLPPSWAATAVAEPPTAGVDCSAPNVVCLTADAPTRIEVTTPNVVYDGRGFSSVGITVNADHVTVQNFNFTNCASHCVWVKGTGNVVQDNRISQVYHDGDDIDGLRFFGDRTQILRNSFTNILKGPKRDSHLDCMQTWASSETGGGSSGVVIEGNHCDDPNFRQCLMVEGPRSTDGGGGGAGVTANWRVAGNHFSCHANQTIALRDVHNVVIQGNHFAGSGRKAIQQTDGTSGILLLGNVLGPGYGRLTGD